MLLLTVYLLFSTFEFNLINTYKKWKKGEGEVRSSGKRTFQAYFWFFDALSGFSALLVVVVLVVNLILIGGRSIKPVPISNPPLFPLPTTRPVKLIINSDTAAAVAIPLFVGSAMSMYACV